MASSINVILRIMGEDFDPKIISHELSIDASETWRKGDVSSEYNTIKKYDCWLYEMGYNEIVDINDLLKPLYLKFIQKSLKLRELVDRYDLNISLDIVIKMYNNFTPALYLDKKIIDLLYHIKAEVDIDMYIVGEETHKVE